MNAQGCIYYFELRMDVGLVIVVIWLTVYLWDRFVTRV